jgi:preprotein translocase subunit SecG
MQTVLLVIHLMIALALCVVVLMQRSEGGALGMGGGGGGGFMTGRGAANALTRMTAYLGAAFFASSIALTLYANHSVGGPSIIDTPASSSSPTSGTTPAAPASGQAPARGGILDKLQTPGSGQAPVPRAPQGQ